MKMDSSQTRNSSKASSSHTVTTAATSLPFPTLRLSFRPNFERIIGPFIQRSLAYFSERITFIPESPETNQAKANHENDLDKVTQRNIEKLKKIFKEMNDGVDQLEEQFLNYVKDLSKEEQEEMEKAWENIVDYLSGVIKWCHAMSDRVIEDLKQGKKINPDELNRYFRTAIDKINSIKYSYPKDFIQKTESLERKKEEANQQFDSD
jgi:hypothetical protein